MFTVIKNWIETISVRTDVGLARAQMRTMRQLQQTIAKLESLQVVLDDAYDKSGDRSVIAKAYAGYRKAYRLEINKLIHVFLLNTTLLNRHLEEFERLISDGNILGGDPTKTVVFKNLKGMIELMESQIKRIIQQVTSFDNANYSAQRLIDIASQAREAQNDFRKAVIDERALKRVRKLLEKDVRTGRVYKRDEDASQQLLAALKDDMDAEAQATGILLLMLQEILSHLAKQEERVNGYELREKYPHLWAQEDLQGLHDLETEIHRWIGEEIPKLRLFMSKSERIAA